jgi:hypothetical protein
MPTRAVLVVGETPSLGRSIVDLLESSGVPTRFVTQIDALTPLSELSAEYPVVVAACNESFCSTARRWLWGEVPNVAMVVVGARDPALVEAYGLRLVPLPLVPVALLGLIRGLLVAGDPASRPADSPQDGNIPGTQAL